MTLIPRKVDLVSVDATDDIEPTKINYRAIPSGIPVPSVTFTAPGITETRASVINDFYFTYNQSDLASGENLIRLSYLGCNTDLKATRTPVPKGPANEIAIAWMPTEEGAPPLPYPIAHQLTTERYYRITYNAPVIAGSYTLLIGSADVKVEADSSLTIGVIIEKHRYIDSGGTYCNKIMNIVSGNTLPPTTVYRKFFESSDSKFMRPGLGLTGIAKLDTIAFDDYGLVFPIMINNSEVDQTLE